MAVTYTDLALLLPQESCAFTEIVPLTVPMVTEMELVVELPDHPGGKVQI